jgi:hypothetical protein
MKSNDVRTPPVTRGEAVIVARYNEDKVALLHPEDLAMLEESHEALLALGDLEALPVDELTVKTLAAEDRPDAQSIEDPAQIAALLGL